MDVIEIGFIITADTTYGCDRDRVSSSSELGFLCVRSFGSGGAGNDPAPTTFAVGDTYVDKDGIALGTVAKVDSTGKHGIVITSGGIASETEAGKNCLLKTTGNLSWALASAESVCNVAEPFGSGTIPCSYITVDGKGACLSDGWYNLTNGGNCSSATTFGYYCEASF